jgi:uncharacterized Zn finger protein
VQCRKCGGKMKKQITMERGKYNLNCQECGFVAEVHKEKPKIYECKKDT